MMAQSRTAVSRNRAANVEIAQGALCAFCRTRGAGLYEGRTASQTLNRVKPGGTNE